MSTYTQIKRLYKEIDQINAEIDTKIEKGLSYKSLSKRHKSLVEQLRSLDRPSTFSIGLASVWPKGLMGKLAQYASVFLM